MSNEITVKLQEMLHRCQAWIDNERYITKEFNVKNRSEEFAEKVKAALETEMIRQKFSFQGERIYLPTKYVISISQQDNLDFTGLKREVLLRELNKFVKDCFRLVGMDSSDNEFIQLNAMTELKTSEVKIQHYWEEKFSPEIVFNKHSYSNEFDFTEDQCEKTIIAPRLENFEDGENETVIRQNFKRLFCLEIYHNGNPYNCYPIFQPEISLGRGSATYKVDITLKDDLQISRHHAVLNYQNDGLFNFTVTGQNPALVGTTPIFKGQSVNFKLEDYFQIGSYQLKTTP